MRAVADGGRPPSTNSPVGRSVAGSNGEHAHAVEGHGARQDPAGAAREAGDALAAVHEPDEVVADALGAGS
jgi:hypothetical protein